MDLRFLRKSIATHKRTGGGYGSYRGGRPHHFLNGCGSSCDTGSGGGGGVKLVRLLCPRLCNRGSGGSDLSLL